MEEKRCSKCKEVKTFNNFYTSHYAKDGLTSQCKKCAIEGQKLYQKNHTNMRREISRRYCEKHPEKRREACKKYILNHPEKRRESCRNWWKKYPEKQKAITIRRRAILKGALSEQIDLIKVYENHNWVCGICGKKINKKLKYPNKNRISLDHIIPISKGGNHTYNNVQPAHLRCNVFKNNKINNIQLRLA